MTALEDFGTTPPFEIRLGGEQRHPFVFNSPHSGAFYPERFRAASRLDQRAIRRSEDCYVDALFSGAVSLGAPMLVANFPRAYLDVNREPFELDPRMFADRLPPYANIRSARVAGGLGTIPRLVGEGLEIYRAKLEFAEAASRIEAIYHPYHDCLAGLLAQTHARFSHCVLIDCHSMPASIRVSEGNMRPDFIIGDRFGSSCAPSLTDTVVSLLSSMGYRVAHNKPYAGGFITEHYGRPAQGMHALQIEINRGLYMNEQTLEPTSGFEPLANDLAHFAALLMEIAFSGPSEMPLAAE